MALSQQEMFAERVLDYAAELLARKQKWQSGDFSLAQMVMMEAKSLELIQMIDQFATQNNLTGVVD